MAAVLFVDDDKYFVAEFAERLGDAGHTVEWAGNVADARRALLSRQIALVVLDISMPSQKLSDLLAAVQQRGLEELVRELTRQPKAGFDLYRTLVNDFPSTQIVILSVEDEADIRSQALDLTFACMFLVKGKDDADNIYRTLHEVLAGTYYAT